MQIAGLLIVAVIALGLLVWAGQRKLIYLPLDQRVPKAATVLPGAAEVVLTTDDGLRLDAWFVTPPQPPRAWVLVFHGNAGSRADRAPLGAELAGRGFGVLLVDYRGYGGNPGRPTEAGLLADARAARQYLLGRGDVDPERLIYFGESLGTGVAVALAAEDPPAALVLRSPFTSLTDLGRLHYPFLPVRWLLVDRYDSIDRAPRLGCPLLVVAGADDRIVPASLSRALFDAAGPRIKEFVLIDGADHNDYALLAGERLLAEIDRFWTRAQRAPAEDRG